MDVDGRQLHLFSIGTVQKLTGLTPRQIRYYEQHNLVSPVRSAGKQRLFSLVDVQRLMKIRELVELGLTMKRVKQKLSKWESTEDIHRPGPTDTELYRMMQEQLLKTDASNFEASMFRGELARFIRRK
ncbi:MerR family transcriptional regulator [Alicyclobacillus tolerans]|uniref:MerR family transcriptional regulator n=1 Tax=Alicyclobacillus tolerans TaxID=90970 RepID=UPI001F021817|nr:MerR family transcriptional regulator [Alicyclobacillus tolerans]MCF8563132.1 MerR family transcriptional regulator [Alicyclobacillus tolerans]